jgi:hypothetical protein
VDSTSEGSVREIQLVESSAILQPDEFTHLIPYAAGKYCI